MTAASWQARGGATPNKGQRYPAEVLTADEVTALLRRCSHRAPTGIRNRALLMLLYRSGLRVAEVLALRPADVNLTAHTVRVLHGKGNKATTRGFHPSAADALARGADTRRGAGIRGRTLFCTLAGGPLHPQYVRNLLHRLAARAGISKRVHPHGLRHTFAWELERRHSCHRHLCPARPFQRRRHRPVPGPPDQPPEAVTALGAAGLPEVGL